MERANKEINKSAGKIVEFFTEFDMECSKLLRYYPRHERYCHAKDIRNTISRIFHLIFELEKKYFKKTSITELDIELE